MESIERLELYLRAQLAALHTAGPEEQADHAHPFVTISRQAGAGGHSLADTLLDAFGRRADTELFGHWQVFDQRLCNMVASNPAFASSLDSLLAEEYRRPANDLFHQVLRSTADQDLVMAHVFELVRSLATIGNAIIVGRAASQVTQGMGPAVRLRVVAPEPQRIARLMELHGLKERKARNEMRRLDAGRARLIRVHFDMDIDDPTQYDAVWNTASASLPEIAESTAALLEGRIRSWQPA